MDKDWPGDLPPYAGKSLLYRNARLADVIAHCRGRLVYLATPFSKIAVGDDGQWDVGLSIEAMMRAAHWARHLALEGITAVSPIVQSTEMVLASCVFESDPFDPMDADFWTAWCAPLLEASAAVVVPPIRGWREILGIRHEVIEALTSGRPVFVLHADEGEQVDGSPIPCDPSQDVAGVAL